MAVVRFSTLGGPDQEANGSRENSGSSGDAFGSRIGNQRSPTTSEADFSAAIAQAAAKEKLDRRLYAAHCCS